MEYQFDQQGKEGELSLSGSVTIDHAGDLKVALLDALSGSDSVMVDLSKADSIDLACMQLLCSAHHTAGTMGKSFSIASKRSDGVMRSVSAAGYLRHTGCKYDAAKTCVWIDQTWKGVAA